MNIYYYRKTKNNEINGMNVIFILLLLLQRKLFQIFQKNDGNRIFILHRVICA